MRARAERRLQAEHPRRRLVERRLLGLLGVGRVVGGDAVDGAVGQAGPDGGDVGVGAQRRVDLEHRVVGRALGVGEGEVVGRRLAGDRQALGLGGRAPSRRSGRWRGAGSAPELPVRRASARSRMTISSSASAGWPGMPSRDDHSPSCMWPPAESTGSSQCWASTTALPGRPPAYSRARRIRRASATPAPSSVKNRTPSSAISASGASCSPARPTVMAPEVCTSHGAARPSSSTSRTMPAWSMAGTVFGMARMHV